MIDVALGKPIPNSTGLYSTDCRRNNSADWTMNDRAVAAVQVAGKSSTIPASLNPVVIVHLPVIHHSPHLPGPFSPSTAKSRPTKPPTAGGHNLTFPCAQPGHCEPVWGGWAEATHVYTTRGEKRFENLRIKTACKCADEQTLKEQLHGLGPAARIVHFMSAAVTVPYPAIWLHHHPLCGVDSVHRHILLMGTCQQCAGFMVWRWPQSQEGDWARLPFVQVCTTWTLTCAETVQQRPCATREIENWLSYSRVGFSVVDHRSRRPVLSPVCSCLDRCHVWPYWASRCKPWRWMLKDISIHSPIWMGFDDLKHIVSCHFTT